MKRYTGWSSKQRCFCTCGVWVLTWWHMEVFWFLILKAFWTFSLWVFMEIWLVKLLSIADWFNLWPLSPFQDWKFQLSIHDWLPSLYSWLEGNQPSLGAFQRSPPWHKLKWGGRMLVMNNKKLISPLWLWGIFKNSGQETKLYNKRCSYCFYCSGNSKGLGSCEPVIMGEEQIYTGWGKCRFTVVSMWNAVYSFFKKTF